MTKTNEFLYDFHLFEGEGGGAAAGAPASSSDSAQDIARTEYGKSRGNEQTSRQVGSDNGGQASDLNAEWKALTGKGGKFHDLYGQSVSGAIQDRFKNQQDLQGQVNQIADDLSPLFMNYGLKSGDFEGLKDAIAHDDSFYQAGAERAGLDINQYKQNLKLQAEAERGRQITEAFEQQQRQNEMYAQWEQEADALRQALPQFDLGLEIENNETFAKLIYNGVDVPTAFRATHADVIDQGMAQDTLRRATQNVINTIQQRAARPYESAVSHAPAIQRKSDPSSLTGADIDEINRRIETGEVSSVSF